MDPGQILLLMYDHIFPEMIAGNCESLSVSHTHSGQSVAFLLSCNFWLELESYRICRIMAFSLVENGKDLEIWQHSCKAAFYLVQGHKARPCKERHEKRKLFFIHEHLN